MNKRTLAALGVALAVMGVVAGCIYVGNIHPIANFSATPTSGTTPLDVDFDASSSTDADGTIVAYVWDFGDGQTASLTVAVVTHQFTVQSESDTFRVLLTVVDDDGAEDEASHDITVNP